MAKQTFTTGQVLTADNMTSLQQTAMGGGSATAKTASYTLVAADAGTTVIMNSASATTITVNTALFAAGDTVFIVNQGAGICTITAGTATVNTAGSLAMSQYETGELYFLSTSAAIFSEYTQAAASAGKIAQVLSTTKTDTFSASISSGASTAITGLSQSITPTSASSKILVTVSVSGNMANRNGFGASIARGSTLIGIGDSSGSRTRVGAASAQAEAAMTGNLILEFLDSPATTSATTYNVYANNMNVDTRTTYVNRAETDNDSVDRIRTASTITVMEITA